MPLETGHGMPCPYNLNTRPVSIIRETQERELEPISPFFDGIGTGNFCPNDRAHAPVLLGRRRPSETQVQF